MEVAMIDGVLGLVTACAFSLHFIQC